MKAVKITDKVWWVGAVDWNLRNFHGHVTPRGSTYNAYLVVDKKIALIDTVKAGFSGELLKRISSVVPLEKIDYVISNHVEMDHSGSLPAIYEAAPNAQFVTNKRAADDLKRHYKSNWIFQIVKTGDSISLGKTSLSFVEVAMVHWPDSMVTYFPEEKILFPNDAFGQHLATIERFDDQLEWRDTRNEAAKYYANIVLPFGGPVLKALDAISKLKVKIIAPSHGIIWRENAEKIVEAYAGWAAGKTGAKAVIVYDTMWNSTEKMAASIADGISSSGIETKIFNLRNSDISEITKEILEARAIVIGSPTLNNGMLPTVSEFLTHIKGLKPKGRIGFAFGSFGWGGGGTKAVEAEMTATGIELVQPAINFKYIPDDAELLSCFEAGVELAKKIRQI